jgi:rare lipoprotein A
MKSLLLPVCVASIAFGFSTGAAYAEFSPELMYNFETDKWNDVDTPSRARARVERDLDAAILEDEDEDEVSEPRRQPKRRAVPQSRPSKKATQRPTTRRTVRAVDRPVEPTARPARRAAATGGGRFVRRTGRPASDGGPSSGIASYYWQPQRVASGGWFNPNAMTAAHKTLPFGTRVRVTHARTGRSVDVTINDRGPFVRGRVIDLSRAAAGALGMQGAGLAAVRIDVLGR